MEKKKRSVKDFFYFCDKKVEMEKEMIQEIIRRLENSEEAKEPFGLNLHYDFRETDEDKTPYRQRFLESFNFGNYRLDNIKKIGKKWVFGLFSLDDKCVECYAIDDDNDVVTDIFSYETLIKIISLLDAYEIHGEGVITNSDEWVK